jgi:hypothetical protein
MSATLDELAEHLAETINKARGLFAMESVPWDPRLERPPYASLLHEALRDRRVAPGEYVPFLDGVRAKNAAAQQDEAEAKKPKRAKTEHPSDDKKTLRAWPCELVLALLETWNGLNLEWAKFVVDYNEAQTPRSGEYLKSRLFKPLKQAEPRFAALPAETAAQTVQIVWRRFQKYLESQGDDHAVLQWHKPYSFYLKAPQIVTDPDVVDANALRDGGEITFLLKAGVVLRCTGPKNLITMLHKSARIKGIKLRRNDKGEWYVIPSFLRGDTPKEQKESAQYDRAILGAVADILARAGVAGMTAADLLPALAQMGISLVAETLGDRMREFDVRTQRTVINGRRGRFYLTEHVLEAAATCGQT